jgi:hypothetical protein
MDKRKNKDAQWRANISKALRKARKKRTKEEKARSRAENLGATAVGVYAGASIGGAALPTQLDIDIARREASILDNPNEKDVFGRVNKAKLDEYYKTNPKYRELVDLEKSQLDYQSKREKYESVVNHTDTQDPKLKKKAVDRLKKKYGANVANDRYASKVKKSLSSIKRKQLNAVLSAKGIDITGKKAAKAALIAGLSAAAATKAFGVLTRPKKQRS